MQGAVKRDGAQLPASLRALILIRLPGRRAQPRTRKEHGIDGQQRVSEGDGELRGRIPAASVPPPFAGPRAPRPTGPRPGADGSSAPEAKTGSQGAPRQGLLPDASWDWRHALAGLLVGFGPAVAFYLLALTSDASVEPAGEATIGTAIALLVSSVVTYVWQSGAAWFFSLRLAGERLSSWGFRRPTTAYFWTIPLALLSVYAITYFHDLLIHPESQDILSRFPRSSVGVAMFALLAVVLAPLFEELFFRGFLFRGLARSWGWFPGAIVSAAAFGIAHVQLSVFVPLFALGFALAWVYKRTGSLWTSISLHALFNGISLVAWVLTG